MTEYTLIYWVRRDFRLTDNPVLHHVSKKLKKPIVPIFFIEPYMKEGDPKFNFGWPQRFFLSKALKEFAKNFCNFYIINDYPTTFFKKLSNHEKIKILVNEDIHPDFLSQVKKIEKNGVEIQVFNDQMTVPKDIRTSSGSEFSVFSPFKRAVWDFFISQKPLPKVAVDTIENRFCESHCLKNLDFNLIFSQSRKFIVSDHLVDLDGLTARPQLTSWYFTEQEALKILDNFIENKIRDYHRLRDFLGVDGTSRLSLALTWGLVSSRTIKHKILEAVNIEHLNHNSDKYPGLVTFISELLWREFYKYLLYWKPWLLNTEFQEKRREISWLQNETGWKFFLAWIEGKTGYSIVDAAMKEIESTGYMHNRSRMVVASILTKNFGVDWRWGQEYFRAALIDLDDASNNGGWQWAASVGADPKPIRIFNPYLQAEKFDPDQKYRLMWLGKKANLYTRNPGEVAQIMPIIDHATARKNALQRYSLLDEDVSV